MAQREESTEVNEESDVGATWKPPESRAVEVRSTAMVKCSRKLPVYQFSRLDQNTNLHRPPDNWLRSGAHQLSKTWVTGECTQFSSFAMAETLPDTVGEVDVISAAENIKKLLKMPFSKAQVSMAVHHVGKTLLLDELDLFKHLRSASQGEREWMKRFLIEAVLSEGKNLTMKRKTNELLQNWNLLSKFLYYSIGNSPEESVPQQTYDLEEQHLPQNQSALIQIPDLLPKAKASEFDRQVLWQFEDIRMLIGTDLPIFGEGIHPAVSLRLKDMSSPINVLTGLDYWLDNLMSNVPELAMCYHLNGIVQKYELLKTEEIPNLEDGKFSPQVVKDIAQNILSFLKSHCTKEGHTYWLFKGQDEDVVKLYDLTSLCNENPNQTWKNPFVSPVAMLLYRVARNLSMAGPSKKDKSIIYKLLKNCLMLLEGSEERHPEVAASASHLLSHIFISDDDLTDTPPPAPHKPTKKPRPKQPPPDSSSGDDEGDEFIIQDETRETSLKAPTMDAQSLMLPTGKAGGFKERRQRRTSAKTVYASREKKARLALKYIVKGLKSIAECPEATQTHCQEQSSKVPSPLPSPTRAKPLCYPKSAKMVETQSLTDDDWEQEKETATAPVKELGDPTASLEMKKPLCYPKSAKMLETQSMTDDNWEREKPTENSPVKELGDPPASKETRNEASEQVVVVSSSQTLPSAVVVEKVASASRIDSSLLKKQTSSDQPGNVCLPLPSRKESSTHVLEVKTEAIPEATDSLILQHFEDVYSGESPQAIPIVEPSTELADTLSSSMSLTQRYKDRKHVPDEGQLPPVGLSIEVSNWHPASWQYKMYYLLLKKAWKVYLVLSKTVRDAERYGRALHLANMSLMCQSACQFMKLADTSSSPNLVSDQLAVCGDCLVLLNHNLAAYSKHREDFLFQTVEDCWILSAVQQLDSTNEYEWAVDFQNNIEHNLRTGILSYTVALSEGTGHSDDYLISLTRKQGNVRNELGVYYMNQALQLRNEEGCLQKEQDLWRKSLCSFEAGIEIFERVKDLANISLLLCNMGKLMRLCAFSLGETEPCTKGSEMTHQERYYYNKATEYYQRALHRLGQRKKNPSLWESVSWELSSTYFTIATTLQDHPPLSYMAQEQVEKDIIDLMNKALKLCEVDDVSPVKQPVYQYRAATIHHRLASMHHNAYRNQSSQQKQKHTRSLAELHYHRAVRLFHELDRPTELLRVLLEKVALLEHHFEGQSGVSARIRTLQGILDTLLQCKDALSGLEKATNKTSARLAELYDGEKMVSKQHSESMDVYVNINNDSTELGSDPNLRTASTSKMSEETSDESRTEMHRHGQDTGDGSVRGQRSQSIDETNEQHRLESMWESRLQYVLRNLVKLHGLNKKGTEHIGIYKKMYAASLARNRPSSSGETLPAKTLVNVLDDIQQLLQTIK